MSFSEINLEQKTSSLSTNVFTAFLAWFFVVAPKKILEIWGNYLVATLSYFSMPMLLKTLFAHWHRDVESYGRGFDFGRYFRVFMMNLVSRMVGFIVRFVVLLMGVATFVVVFIFGLLFLFFWFVSFVALPIFIIWGFKLILL